MKSYKYLIAAAVVGLTLVGAAQANLLLNESFETIEPGDTNFTWLAANWWRDQTPGFADMVDRNNWNPRSGSWDMLVKGWNYTNSGRFGQWVGNAVPIGTILTFSIWGDCEADFTASDVRLGIELFYTGGVLTNSQSIYSDFLLQPGTYGLYTFVTTATVANIYGMSAYVHVDNVTAASGSRSVYFDDAMLGIPEPTVAGLLAVGGLLFAGLRRRMRK
ncbi:MAG: PEP-CTERM sorting domain-containing protein [Verrucomicrobiota bacterium]